MKLNLEKLANIAQQIFSEATGDDLANMGVHGKNAVQEGKTVALIALEMVQRIAAGEPIELETGTRAMIAPELQILAIKGVIRYQSLINLNGTISPFQEIFRLFSIVSTDPLILFD
jgi:hypothetical protein